jgi:hypothetical protein
MMQGVGIDPFVKQLTEISPSYDRTIQLGRSWSHASMENYQPEGWPVYPGAAPRLNREGFANQ